MNLATSTILTANLCFDSRCMHCLTIENGPLEEEQKDCLFVFGYFDCRFENLFAKNVNEIVKAELNFIYFIPLRPAQKFEREKNALLRPAFNSGGSHQTSCPQRLFRYSKQPSALRHNGREILPNEREDSFIARLRLKGSTYQSNRLAVSPPAESWYAILSYNALCFRN